MTVDRDGSLHEIKNKNIDAESAAEQIDWKLPPDGNGSGTNSDASESPHSGSSIPASILGRYPVFCDNDGNAYVSTLLSDSLIKSEKTKNKNSKWLHRSLNEAGDYEYWFDE